MRTPNLRALWPGLALLSTAAPLLAQQGDAEVRREIEFARGLAADWSFVDLSEAVLERIEKRGVSGSLAVDLALVKCEIFAAGARRSGLESERHRLYEEALTAYQTFLRDHAQTDKRPVAESGFVSVSADYAASLARALEERIGEEAEALRKRQGEVLSEAVSKTGDLIAKLKALAERDELGQAERRELFELMLNRGRMLLDLAKSQEDGSFNYAQAYQTFEDLVFTAGEGTPYALRACLGIGDVLVARGQFEDAASFYEDVVNQAVPIERALWDESSKDFTQADKEVRWLFVQLGTQGLVDAHRQAGDAADAMRWGLHFYNTQRREGFSFQPVGYLSLLAVARAALDAGGWIGGSLTGGEAQWYATLDEAEAAGHKARALKSSVDLALQLADQVNKDNPRSILKVYAQKLISDAISRPGVEVDPAVLLEAALGSYNEREYDEAIAGFRRVLRSIDGRDQASQLLQAPKALHYMGQSYSRLDRPLEAAVVFSEACTRFRGDPEFDPKSADGFFDAVKALTQGKDPKSLDPSLQALVADSERLVIELNTGDQGGVLFRRGEQLRKDKDFEGAIGLYRQVTPESAEHEKALVFIGVAQYRQGDSPAAQATLADYLERFLADPANATTSPTRLATRDEARAVAEFYRGLMAYEAAEKGGDWEKPLGYLAGYVQRYPSQDQMGPYAQRLEVLSLLQLGRYPEARERFGALVAAFPESTHTGSAAIEFYKALEERKQAAEAKGDLETARGLLREMAELLKLGNTTSRAPKFENFRRESAHWIELGEWSEAERVLRRTSDLFAADAKLAADVTRYVMPDLAETLLQQSRAADALALLEPSIGAEGVPQTKTLAVDYTRAVIGWVRGDNEPFELVPGAGETDEQFEKAIEFLVQITNAVEKYSCDWLDLKFDLVYAYWIWGQKDSSKLDAARRQIAPLETDYGAGFRGIECEGEEQRSEALRRRFAWLKGKL